MRERMDGYLSLEFPRPAGPELHYLISLAPVPLDSNARPHGRFVIRCAGGRCLGSRAVGLGRRARRRVGRGRRRERGGSERDGVERKWGVHSGTGEAAVRAAGGR